MRFGVLVLVYGSNAGVQCDSHAMFPVERASECLIGCWWVSQLQHRLSPLWPFCLAKEFFGIAEHDSFSRSLTSSASPYNRPLRTRAASARDPFCKGVFDHENQRRMPAELDPQHPLDIHLGWVSKADFPWDDVETRRSLKPDKSWRPVLIWETTDRKVHRERLPIIWANEAESDRLFNATD